MSSTKSDLRIDWATHEAVAYACKNWHYSKSVPVPPLVKVGAWENGKYIGCIIFSRGANNNLLAPFGLEQTQGCELTRIALTKHIAPVSRIVAVAIKFLRKHNPTMQLIVSYADPSQGHHGGVYQAGGWVYTGTQGATTEFIAPDGRQWHARMVKPSGITKVHGVARRVWRTDQCTKVVKAGKHRYLMPLTLAIRDKILPMAKPYPKRVKDQALEYPSSLGGETPTHTLHL